MIKPLNDTVVVEPIKAEEASPGGLLLPEASRENYRGLRATVVAVGPGNWTIGGVRLPVELREGDVVLLGRAGPMVRVGERTLCFVGERDVLAVLGPEAS